MAKFMQFMHRDQFINQNKITANTCSVKVLDYSDKNPALMAGFGKEKFPVSSKTY